MISYLFRPCYYKYRQSDYPGNAPPRSMPQNIKHFEFGDQYKPQPISGYYSVM